jgi:hypothetical protein
VTTEQLRELPEPLPNPEVQIADGHDWRRRDLQLRYRDGMDAGADTPYSVCFDDAQIAS